MVNKLIKSNRGSSLVMVIFYMMVLTMLGTTILSLGLSNFKMKLMDEDVKASLYIAESGLEEAHGIIELEIKNAIDYGNYIVEDNWRRKIDEEYYTYLDDFGNMHIDFERLEEKMDEWFEDAYKEYLTTDLEGKPYGEMTSDEINNSIKPGNYEEKLLDKIANTSYLYDLSVEIQESEVEEFIGDASNFKIISTYSPIDGIEKKLSQRFSIKLANKNETYKMSEPYYIKYDTKLYSLDELEGAGFNNNVITAMGDIIFNQNSNVYIQGNIHANGQNHGVLINNGSIEISKDSYNNTSHKLSTAKDIIINGDNINANFNTNIFCNSLIISENSRNSVLNVGEAGGDVANKHRVFTKDDLELNGVSSHINIYGSYYGFSDGSDLYAEHDNSSAIVINSIDIGELEGSSLTITGDESEEYRFDDNTRLDDGILIYGTTSIDNLYNENRQNKREYQTGESVSIIGNYIAYTDSARNHLSDKDNYLYNPYYYFYDDSDSLEILFADKYNGEDLKVFNSMGKSKTSIIKEVADSSTGILTVNGVNLNEAKIIHTTGAYVSSGSIGNYFNDASNVKRVKISEEYNKMTGAASISIGDLPINIVNEVFVDEEEKIKVVYINLENSAPVTIDNFDSTTIKIPEDKEIYGMIISKGDIIIRGTIKEFNGIIASQGNIYFEGSGEKNIIYDKDIQVTVTKETLDFERESNELETYKKYSDLIEVSGWQIER